MLATFEASEGSVFEATHQLEWWYFQSPVIAKPGDEEDTWSHTRWVTWLTMVYVCPLQWSHFYFRKALPSTRMWIFKVMAFSLFVSLRAMPVLSMVEEKCSRWNFLDLGVIAWKMISSSPALVPAITPLGSPTEQSLCLQKMLPGQTCQSRGINPNPLTTIIYHACLRFSHSLARLCLGVFLSFLVYIYFHKYYLSWSSQQPKRQVDMISPLLVRNLILKR